MNVRAPLACLLALAAAALPAEAKRKVKGIQPFPGPIQPDAGTAAAASRNGKVVAFAASFRDGGGGRYDAAETPTVFAWNRRTGLLQQVTASGPSDQPSAADATAYTEVGTSETKEHRERTLVAFRSSANLVGRNADLSPEIFLWDSSNSGITQVTEAAAGASSSPAVGVHFGLEKDDNGLRTGTVKARTRVAFLSTSDLTGDNPVGLPQVFLYDSGADAVARIVQLSHSTAGAAGPPAVDGEGQRVAFVHDGDLLPGPDAPGTPAVYHWRREVGLRRATDETGACEGAADPALDARGKVVAWSSTDGPGGPRRILVAGVRGGGLLEVAPSAGDHRAPVLGRGPRPLVFLSTDPGDGSAPVAERPVTADRGGGFRDLELSGSGVFGAMSLQNDRRLLFLTTTADLDGRNAAGRDVIYLVPLRR